jgi:hypothetical protein
MREVYGSDTETGRIEREVPDRVALPADSPLMPVRPLEIGFRGNDPIEVRGVLVNPFTVHGLGG